MSRSMMEALLKAEIRGVEEEGGDRGSPSEGDPGGKSPREEEEEEDFFGVQIRGGRPESPEPSSEAEEEVERYLRSPVREVASLHAFPWVRRAFLRHNTALPSSAAVDYLFSTVGHGVDAKRASLPDDLFEQLVLLRQNRPVF